MTDPRKIDIADLDFNLRADVGPDADSFDAFVASTERGYAEGWCFQIVFSAEERRGGIVFVGSGSSGKTSWTDASGPKDVLVRYLTDDMTV